LTNSSREKTSGEGRKGRGKEEREQVEMKLPGIEESKGW
jgi:hypothetical protein